jgi:putative aldouronate transport system substrate-binding protein
MNKTSTLFKMMGLLVALSMLLVACQSAAPATTAPAQPTTASSAPAATQAPAATTAPVATTAPAANVPTLDWYFTIAGRYDDKEMVAVEDAANAILAKDNIGAKVAFHVYTPTDATTKIPLVLNSGESCDLISFGTFTPIQPAISSGGIIPLEDLLPKDAPTVWGDFTQKAWDSTKQGGHIYGALNFSIGGISGAAMWVRKDLVDKYNFDWQSATTPAAWEPFFDEVLKNEKGVTPLISSDPFWGRAWWPNQNGYDPITTSIGAKGDFGGSIAVKMDDPTRKVVSVVDTPEYKAAVTLNRQWYLKGYYLKTPPADAEMGSIRGNKGFSAFYVPFGGFGSTSAMAKNEWAGVPILTAFVQSPLVQTLYSSGSTYGVCTTSKHPDLAVKFIEEMNTNVDLLNLLNYGIQGKDWVWQDQTNKIVTFPAGVDGTTVGWNPNTYWQFGDARLMYLTSPDDIGLADRVATAKKTAIFSNMAGFTLDPTNIESDIANVSSAATQYCDPVDKGLVDVDAGIKACHDGLKAAGIDNVIAEVQKQVDAWAATQK